MWIIPPQLSSQYSAESDGSTCPSASSFPERELWLMLSGTPMQRPCSWRGWKTRAWSRHPFGAATLDNSTQARFLDWWTSSQRARHASPTAAPANNSETQIPEALVHPSPGILNKGRMDLSSVYCGPSRTVAPPWSSSKTFQLGFAGDGFESLESNYRDWVTRSMNLSLLLRQILVRVIGGSGSSFWPSARANDSEKRGEIDCENQRNGLVGAVNNWPTAKATDGAKGGPNQRGSSGDLMLPSAAAKWTTPKASEMNRGNCPSERSRAMPGLLSQAQNWDQTAPEIEPNSGIPYRENMWATPKASQGGADKTSENHTGAPNLKAQAGSWGPPTARDHKDGATTMENTEVNGLLGRQVLGFSHPTPEIQDGGESLPKVPGSRPRLNRVFVSWLMGAPPFWIQTEPMPCAAQVMASWRSAQRQLLQSFFDDGK